MSAIRQLALRESPFCGSCPGNTECHERCTDLGCSPDVPPPITSNPSILHPSSPDFLPRLAEVNGVKLDIRARPQELPILPPYVPRIRPWKRLHDFGGIPAVAIATTQVRTLAAAIEKTGNTAKDILGLANDQLLLVTGFEKDRFLERAWPLQNRYRLLRAIQTIRPDAAIAWGYSVWHRDAADRKLPRIEHLYNQKRSLMIYAQLQDFDVPAIPHIYWGVREDLQRWSDWLARNPCVSTIAMDLQTIDTDADWRAVIRDIRFFSSILPRPIQCLFSGICQIHRIHQLVNIWPNISLCNYAPYFSVIFPRKGLFGLGQRVGDPNHWSPTHIFRNTVFQYTELMRGDEPGYPKHEEFVSGRAVQSLSTAALNSTSLSRTAQVPFIAPESEKTPGKTARDGA